MATFYFNAAVDNEWATLGNWWMDAGFTTPATSLPTSADDAVVVDVALFLIAGGAKAIRNITLSAPTQPSTVYLSFGTLTVTGTATFNNDASTDTANIVGDAVFNGAGGLFYSTVSGNATFNDNSQCGYGVSQSIAAGKQWVFNGYAVLYGTLTGSPTFNNYASNAGTITGNPTFNDGASSGYGVGGTVNGNPTFNGSSVSDGNITGNPTFNETSYNIGNCTLGLSTFNDDSYNAGAVFDAVFNDQSANVSNVDGNGYFNDTASQLGGVNLLASFTLPNAEHQMRQGSLQSASTIEFRYDKGINGSSILGVV